jgi:nitroimidazol reductase NimA-like FMN-containing flavoprotein (pyridoxamine 5'-phosphate oxidase superfamily)
MHETPEDLAALQDLLDRSHAAGGPHLRSIISPEWRLGAAELVERLQGMRLLVVATVTADGRPLTGPLDGIFYRGAFHFGSSPESVKLRHLRARPQVSATHLPGEDLCVTVHGTAVPVDVADPRHAGFRQTLLDIYAPRFGPDWEGFLDSGSRYVRIQADKMFTLRMPPEGESRGESERESRGESEEGPGDGGIS